MEELITLSGTVEDIVFRNNDNGWTVLELASGEEIFTVVGSTFEIAAGDELTVMGQWTNHPNYGRQFKAQSFERKLPATTSAMLKYLSSGTVRGIGPATAHRIIEKFGGDTLNVIEKEPEKLAQIKGVSLSRAMQMSESYKQQFGIRSCMLFLQQYGVTAAEAIRIWKKYGPAAVDIVKKDPYNLCDSGIRISFERADAIAVAMGFNMGDGCRIRAGIIHILRHNLYSSGHTFIPLDKLIPIAVKMLSVPEDDVTGAVNTLCTDENLVRKDIAGRAAIFLPEAFRAESYIAGRLLLMQEITRPVLGDCANRITEAEREFGIEYAEKQRSAIETAYNKGIMILTGGPGTGKTTTINAIIDVYEKMGLKVALAAPTGRAAKRMTQVSGKESKTIHRLLEVEYTGDDVPHFGRNEKNQLDCDALIVDELSMVDVLLLESLLRALKLTCRLVMVGDADQLPPVGAGNALRDMIDSGALPVVKLDEIFRQAQKSLIVTNAHKIVGGVVPDLAKRDGNFFFMQRYTQQQVRETVAELVKTRLPAAYDMSPFEDIQVLVPGRKGELGANELNTVLQDALNPQDGKKPEKQFGAKLFRLHDKVMQIKNNYDIVWTRDDGTHGTGVFNGDVGVVDELNKRTGMMKVRFEDKTCEYTAGGLEELDLAYAVTVHKSQGSEFRAVVLPLFSGAPMLFYRNLLYTAVTRAKELVIIVGRPETVEQMVKNDRKTKRYTGLDCFLKDGVHEE